MPQIRISEAAELLGVSDDTVRRWSDAGRLPTREGRVWPARRRWRRPGGLARELADAPEPGAIVSESARNRFRGIVTRVVRDTVMAQVEIQAGPFRVVSLMSREAADELQPRARRRRGGLGQGDQRRGRSPGTIDAVSAERRLRVVASIGATCLVAALAACAADATDGTGSAPTSVGNSGSAADLRGEITVLAAASLTDVLRRDRDAVRGRAPWRDGDVLVRRQLRARDAEWSRALQADVFATASTATMEPVVAAGLAAGEPEAFVDEPARDRRSCWQPRRRRRARRPGRPRAGRRALRARRCRAAQRQRGCSRSPDSTWCRTRSRRTCAPR